MRKKSKKILYWSLGIAGILIVAVALFLVFGLKQVQFPYGETVTIQLASSNQYSNTYTINVANKNPTTGSCSGADTSLYENIQFYNFNTVSLTNGPYYICNGVQVSEFDQNAINSQCPNFAGLSSVFSNINPGAVVNTNLGFTIPIASGSCSPGGSTLSCNLQMASAMCGDHITSYSFTVTLPKIGYCLDSSQCSSGQVCSSSNVCQTPQVPNPVNPSPPSGLFANILALLKSWLQSLFNVLFPQTIYGQSVVQPNTQATYNISLSAPIPNSNYSSGNYSVQYANWALTDANGNILNQGTWQQVNGTYNQSVTLTAPSNIGSYVLVGIIYQYDMQYSFTNNSWSTISQEVVDKEGYNLQTQLPIPVNPTAPTLNFFQNLLNSIWNFFKSLFGL